MPTSAEVSWAELVVPDSLYSIDADTNRDGQVVNEPQDHEEKFTNEFGAIVLVNSDDDDDDDGVDWSNTQVLNDDDEKDLAEIKVGKLDVDPMPAGWTVTLTLQAPVGEPPGLDMPPAVDRIRIYYRDDSKAHPNRYVAILGRGIGGSYPFPNPPSSPQPDLSGSGTVTLYVEGCEFAADVFIVLTVKDAGSNVVSTDRVRIMPAPFIVQSNIRDVEKVFVHNDGEALRDRIVALFGATAEAYTDSPQFIDQWPQDEWEFGTSSWPARAGSPPVMPSGLDLPRTGALDLDGYGRTVLTGPVPDPNYRHGGWAEEGTNKDSGQFGGNLEVSPPLPAPSPFRLGRIVVGNTMVDQDVLNFLKRQRIQAKWDAMANDFFLISLDVSWLAVGHIDEIMNFVPGTSGSKGFKVVLADPARALALLGAPPVDPGDVKNYATFFYGSPTDLEEGGATTADSGPNTLIDNTNNFTNTKYEYVRIYESPNPNAEGQVAKIDKTNSAGNTLRIIKRWTIPNSETVRKALQEGAVIDSGATWDVNPPAGSFYVLVEHSQFWFLDVPAIITAKEVREDKDLWDKNIDWGAGSTNGRITAAKDVLKTELGLLETDFIRLPVFYMAPQGMGNQIAERNLLSDAGGAAMIPNMVNLVVLNGRLIAPRPFGPRWLAASPKDVYENEAQQLLHAPADGRTIEAADFVDDWDKYHRLDGETHCGTNVRRVPTSLETEWWKNWKNEDTFG